MRKKGVGGKGERGRERGESLLGLLRLALWPPATFPEFADMVLFAGVCLGGFVVE